MTYPLVGNYGINTDDFESRKVQVEGFVVKELCDVPSNWRSIKKLEDFLIEYGIMGIQGVDTRALTKKLRVYGVMMGAISTEETPEETLERIKKSPNYSEIDFVRKVSTPKIYRWTGERTRPPNQLSMDFSAKYRVVVIDCGVKYNILRLLNSFGCEVIVMPCWSKAEEISAFQPNGLVLSPGPGDPALLTYLIQTIKELLGKLPIMGICLGNQLLGWAFGGKTYKLKFGHRGANHPVKDLETDRVYITAQNHGYAVDADSLRGSGLEVSHINLNDFTVEGLRHKDLPIFSIQYHPEASPGPQDNRYLFERFIELMER
ncbi:MAG: glutamine-hydrolyzing carbamoyl-phosphate synthase small subunit [Halobacteria archaeon]